MNAELTAERSQQVSDDEYYSAKIHFSSQFVLYIYESAM